jgi:hypothetical protein
MAIIEAGLAAGRGRYPTTFPDLIENVDVFDRMAARMADPWGGTGWGATRAGSTSIVASSQRASPCTPSA